MKKNGLAIFTIILLGLSSCNFYKPTVINAPVLEEKGEINVGVSVGSSSDFNLSYSATDHIAVIAKAGTSYTQELSVDNGTGTEKIYEFNNNHYEGAIGYYSSQDDDLFYNVFLGYAAGEAGSFVDDATVGLLFLDGGFQAQYSGLFLQTSVHANLSNVAFMGLVAKINSLKFSDFEYTFDPTINGRYEVREDQNIVGQIALDFNFKGDRVGGFTQLQYAFDNNNEEYFTTRKLGFYGGIYLRIGALLK